MSINPEVKFNKIIMKSLSKDFESYLENNDKLELTGFSYSILQKQKIKIIEIIFLYLYDKRPLSIGYSGGKDSTIALDITLKALLLIKEIYGVEKLSKKSFVLFSDTLMELDPIINGIYESLENIRNFCNKHKLNVQVEKVSPELKNSFWSLILGKGYILPNKNNRFCSERMKILPQQNEIERILSSYEGFIAITGQRADESQDRKERLEVHTIEGSFKSHDYKGCHSYTPIEDFNSNQVWDYIYNDSFDWVDKNYLGKVYAEATDDGDECRSLLMGFEAQAPQCGRSGRFGCWICPLHFNKDKTLNNLGKKYTYLQKMEQFRNWLVEDATGVWNWKRDYFIHGKHKMKMYDIKNHRYGMQLPGGYSLQYRKDILVKLMSLELEVFEERNGKYLISDEELSYIQEIWIEDGDIDLSVVNICKHRKVTVQDRYKRVVQAATKMLTKNYYIKGNEDSPYGEVWHQVKGLNPNTCARYYTLMALQIEDAGYDSILILDALRHGEYEQIKPLIAYVKTLLVETKMDFLDEHKERYIKDEWKRDKLGFIPFLELYESGYIKKPQDKLIGFEGDYDTHFQGLEMLDNGTDIIDIPNELISLQDKMRWFEDW
ncbi:phosphoadenosine phosphosulfate reductase family protein [Aliarcobacter butzleri]